MNPVSGLLLNEGRQPQRDALRRLARSLEETPERPSTGHGSDDPVEAAIDYKVRMRLRNVFLSLIFTLAAVAQPQGVAPAWEVRATMNSLIDNARRYRALVDQFAVNDWIAKGASETYRKHKEAVLSEAEHLQTVAERSLAQPERLSLALDVLFRLQSIESLSTALSEGAGRYEQAALAEQLQALVSGNAAIRAHLRQYVLDLSSIKEEEQEIAQREAERCQAILNRNPLAPAPKRTSRKSQP